MTDEMNDSDKLDIDTRFEKIPWTEKYRPKTLDEIYLPDMIKKKLSDIITNKNIPNIIFEGQSGVGKSVAIRVLAESIYGKYYNDAVYEMGLMDTANFLQGDLPIFCRKCISYLNKDINNYPKYKLVIFNEADTIEPRMQDKISSIIEEYNNKIRFVFTCNSTAKIDETVQSKCLVWKFPPISTELIANCLKNICVAENIDYTEDALTKIAMISFGDVRMAINRAELIYTAHDEIKDEHIYKLFHIPKEFMIKNLFGYMQEKNIKECLKIVYELKKNSYSGSDIMNSMLITLNSKSCKDIDENIRMLFNEKICDGIYRISHIGDNNLQLSSCIVDLCS